MFSGCPDEFKKKIKDKICMSYGQMRDAFKDYHDNYSDDDDD